jgi:hypothetical protein
MSDYRKAIEGTIKVLDGAQRTPISDERDFQGHVSRLRQQLTDIERNAQVELKYPGSTGNGDKNNLKSGNISTSLMLYDQNAA